MLNEVKHLLAAPSYLMEKKGALLIVLTSLPKKQNNVIELLKLFDTEMLKDAKLF